MTDGTEPQGIPEIGTERFGLGGYDELPFSQPPTVAELYRRRKRLRWFRFGSGSVIAATTIAFVGLVTSSRNHETPVNFSVRDTVVSPKLAIEIEQPEIAPFRMNLVWTAVVPVGETEPNSAINSEFESAGQRWETREFIVPADLDRLDARDRDYFLKVLYEPSAKDAFEL